MDIRKVKKLIELLEESNCVELEIKEGEESVRISRSGHVAAPMQMMAPAPQMTQQAAPAAQETANVPASKPKVNGHEVKSPMVGTVYHASSPDTPSFVQLGQSVKAGQTLCLVEAMKMFNPIEADTSGTIAEILVENGEPVEYGQTLFIIQK